MTHVVVLYINIRAACDQHSRHVEAAVLRRVVKRRDIVLERPGSHSLLRLLHSSVTIAVTIAVTCAQCPRCLCRRPPPAARPPLRAAVSNVVPFPQFTSSGSAARIARSASASPFWAAAVALLILSDASCWEERRERCQRGRKGVLAPCKNGLRPGPHSDADVVSARAGYPDRALLPSLRVQQSGAPMSELSGQTCATDRQMCATLGDDTRHHVGSRLSQIGTMVRPAMRSLTGSGRPPVPITVPHKKATCTREKRAKYASDSKLKDLMYVLYCGARVSTSCSAERPT